jgi:inhibitor of KinA
MSNDWQISPLGDRALVVRCGVAIDEGTFHRVQALSQRLEESPPLGIIEYVPAFTTVTIYYDPLRVSLQILSQAIDQLAGSSRVQPPAQQRTVEIPVCYGDEFGPDLEEVACHNQLAVDEVVAIHAAGEYRVHMLGFVPGFPYLGGMSPRIATPRRSTPRLKVPAGSVGIGGSQTGIYPFATPGGWQLIGRTPLALFRPLEDPPTLLAAGDVARFRPITPQEFQQLAESAS